MLDNFLPEGRPFVPTETTPRELEGFISEAELPQPPATPGIPNKSITWRRASSSAALMWTACLCGALTIGAVAMPLRSGSSQLDVPELQHARVFVPKTLVQIPAVRFMRVSTSPAPQIRKRTPKKARRAKVLAPRPRPAVAARQVNNRTSKPKTPARVQPVRSR